MGDTWGVEQLGLDHVTVVWFRRSLAFSTLCHIQQGQGHSIGMVLSNNMVRAYYMHACCGDHRSIKQLVGVEMFWSWGELCGNQLNSAYDAGVYAKHF